MLTIANPKDEVDVVASTHVANVIEGRGEKFVPSSLLGGHRCNQTKQPAVIRHTFLPSTCKVLQL